MPLHDSFFPIGMVTKSGRIIDSTKSKNPPRLIISPNSKVLPVNLPSNKFLGVLAEITPTYAVEQIVALKEWANNLSIPFIFFISADPPSNAVIKFINMGIPYWGWDISSLRDDCRYDCEKARHTSINIHSKFCNNFEEIKNRSFGVKRVLIPIKEDNLNRFFKNARSNYCELLNTARKENFPPAFGALHRFLGVIYSLEEMLAPLSYSEKELSCRWGMRTISDRLDALKLRNQALEEWNPLFSSYLSKSIIELDSLYDYMFRHAYGKPSIILQAIREAEVYKSRLMIIARNDASNAALIAFLHDKTGLSEDDLCSKGIFLRSVNATNKVPPIDTCMIYGPPRYYQRYLLELSITKRLGIPAYESEIAPLKYLNRELDNRNALFSAKSKVRTINLINNIPQDIAQNPIKFRSRELERTPRSKIIEISPLDAETDEKEFSTIFSDFLSNDFRVDYEDFAEASVDYEQRVLEGNPLKEYAEAMKIELCNNKYIFLRVNEQVPIYEDFNDKVKDKLACELKNNDILVLIDSSTTKSLVESIIAKVEGHPKMMEVVFYQRLWTISLRRCILESGDKPQDVIRKLQSKGAKSPQTPMAIYFWMKGNVLGPKDNANVRRIGEIYNNSLLIDNYDEIIKAIRRLRGIHQSLSRKLHWLVPRVGIANEAEGSEDRVIDEELNLYLDDFADTISLERVNSVSGPIKVKADIVDKVLSY